jgi:hypothetical protein
MNEEHPDSLMQRYSENISRLNRENAELWVQLMLAQRELQGKNKCLRNVDETIKESGDNNKSVSRFFQKEEIAKRLNKSNRWVEIQCKSGRIPFIKIGRSVFFDWNEVCESLRVNSSVRFVRKY